MTKDSKLTEGKGTPARTSGPVSKVQSKVQPKVRSKIETKVPSKMETKVPSPIRATEQPGAHSTVPSQATVQVSDRAVTLAAAAILALPLAVLPTPVAAQSAAWPLVSPTAPASPNETTKAAGQEGTLIIRMERTFTVLGVGDGHTVFKDVEDATFYIDPATGDKQSVPRDYFLTRDEISGARHAGKIKFTNVMIVSILGADAHGNTVMRNARNETFTLDPRTGNKVLIKWPK